jgi:hypothetical protein
MEPQAECILVLIGATPEGKKELLGLQTGMRESGQSWKELLVDLNRHPPDCCRLTPSLRRFRAPGKREPSA